MDHEYAALADYRVLMAADNADLGSDSGSDSGSESGLCLREFTESTAGSPIEPFNFDGRLYSRSSLNYLLGLSRLKRHLGG